MLRTILVRATLLIVFFAAFTPAHAQQTDIKRYEIYSGFTYFETPTFNLAERGYHLQAGYNARRWMGIGFDYSIVTGHNSLTPNLLTTPLQTQIDGLLALLKAEGVIPPSYQLAVPTDNTTETYAAGPQLVIRHYIPVTIFVRPSIGAIHETATPRPTDPVATAIVAELAPSGKKTDWTGFYGFGGGFDWNVTPHFGLRAQADFVHNHLFDDLLKDGRWTTRASIGPVFHFGKNITK
ncbi:hypothetical protein [Acidobacterium sp. S8]|uniref:hypothetical protein n=1 Tax=Acidobacterium sp. S8 TaxID=1641854 RepID=UPI00131B41A8|nr:hypothetical protein [Acidobacterium sp. S8]